MLHSVLSTADSNVLHCVMLSTGDTNIVHCIISGDGNVAQCVIYTGRLLWPGGWGSSAELFYGYTKLE